MEGRSLALTVQEIAECRSEEELFDLETNGLVVVEILLFLYAILAMHVLLEEWYVPALELVTSPDVLDVPRPLLGCTIMAAGNCLPELSMSLIALLWTGSAESGRCRPNPTIRGPSGTWSESSSAVVAGKLAARRADAAVRTSKSSKFR